MGDWQLVKLDFGRNPVHFGELGIGMEESSERAYSDTLFSAWVSSYVKLFGSEAVKQLLDQFPQTEFSEREPPFCLSSTLICQDETYYLPRPIARPRGYPADDLAFAKEYKKLNYLPLRVWQRWYQDEGFDPEQDGGELIEKTTRKETSGILAQAKTFDYHKTYQSQRLPKVSLDRTTRASNFYHVGFVQFQPNTGLYFLIYFPNPNPVLKAELQAALELLGEDGIGGEKSSGAGRFTTTWHELDDQWRRIVSFNNSNAYSLMSLLWELPLRPEYLLGAKYGLQERSGWIVSPASGQQARRQAIQMFTEGSVFPQPIAGMLANVTPTKFKAHPIYRSGISLSFPIQLAS